MEFLKSLKQKVNHLLLQAKDITELSFSQNPEEKLFNDVHNSKKAPRTGCIAEDFFSQNLEESDSEEVSSKYNEITDLQEEKSSSLMQQTFSIVGNRMVQRWQPGPAGQRDVEMTAIDESK